MNKTIWIAECLDSSEIICAATHYDDVIDYLCENNYLNGSLRLFEKDTRTLAEVYGENWIKILKSFSSVKFNHLFGYGIYLRQVDLIDKGEN